MLTPNEIKETVTKEYLTKVAEGLLRHMKREFPDTEESATIDIPYNVAQIRLKNVPPVKSLLQYATDAIDIICGKDANRLEVFILGGNQIAVCERYR